jgi:hypothetical protein
MFDFKSDPQTLGIQYSTLTDDDLKTIWEAEQKISQNHNSNQVLIAYDQSGTEQSGARS